MMKYQRYEYLKMLMGGTWNQYLHDVEVECHREVELAVKRIMEKEGVTEQLKKEDPMKWVRRVNGIKVRGRKKLLINCFRSLYQHLIYLKNIVLLSTKCVNIKYIWLYPYIQRRSYNGEQIGIGVVWQR